jgi:hypothetical protein
MLTRLKRGRRLAATRCAAVAAPALALALAILAAANAAPSSTRGFTLVTAEEYRELKERASKVSPESAPPEARAFDINAPKILVDAPKPGVEQHPPLHLALRFEPAADAKIDLTSFQVIYKLGLVRMDITDRIRPFVRLTEAGVTGSSSAAIPPGTHTVIVRIRDSLRRLGEQTITFRVAPS